MLLIVSLTALGVGGTTMVGALLGYCCRGIAGKCSRGLLAFSAGIMLASAMVGLILPSLTMGGRFAAAVTVSGIFCGALLLHYLNGLIPRMQRLSGAAVTTASRRVLLFVAAIAIHNLPEGLAAGVGFGTGDIAKALTIAGGIAVQNLPEGMILIAPMLSAGISPRRTLLWAMATGVIEIFGTFFGFFAVSLCTALLPFVLAMAGGTMLYVICDEMLLETKGGGYSLLAGFCVMLLADFYLG